MHSSGALWHARDVGAGPDAGAVRAPLRCHSDVESRRGDLRGYDRARLHENGNGGTLCADCAGHAPAGPAAAAVRGRYREAVAGANEVFWRKDGRVDADCDGEGAGEGELRIRGLCNIRGTNETRSEERRV